MVCEQIKEMRETANKNEVLILVLMEYGLRGSNP